MFESDLQCQMIEDREQRRPGNADGCQFANESRLVRSRNPHARQIASLLVDRSVAWHVPCEVGIWRKTAFEEHCEQTEGQVARIEQIFEMLEKPARAKQCVGMEGLIEEGTELMDEGEPESPAMDAGLIACGQKVSS